MALNYSIYVICYPLRIRCTHPQYIPQYLARGAGPINRIKGNGRNKPSPVSQGAVDLIGLRIILVFQYVNTSLPNGGDYKRTMRGNDKLDLRKDLDEIAHQSALHGRMQMIFRLINSDYKTRMLEGKHVDLPNQLN